jgi:hypothetical protein
MSDSVPTNLSRRFIGYHLEVQHPESAEQTVPVAVARDADECYKIAATRVLCMGGTTGYIAVQDRTEDVTEAEYAHLAAFLADHFKEVQS